MIENRDRLLLAILIFTGLIIRLVYFIEYRSLIEFLYPTVDALYHHLSAKAIASGALTSSEPFFRAPFYNYFLGLIYAISGDSIAIARFAQLLIGTLTAPLVYLLGREIFDRRVGFVAALLTLFCTDIVYFEGELVLEATAMWLSITALLSLILFVKRGEIWSLILTSVATGLAIIDRPNMAVLVVPIILAILHLNDDRGFVGRVRAFSIFAAVTLIPIGVVLAHNLSRVEPAFAIATQGGINFYLGNNEDADGISAVMPGKLGYNWQYSDIKYLAESETGSKLTPSEISSHYFAKGIRFIKDEPRRWIALTAKKAYLFFSGEDLSNNRNLTDFKSQIPIFKFLPIGMGVLAPLGLVGMILIRRDKRAMALVLYLVLYTISFLLFFVSSRFRLPVLPILAILSAVTVMQCFDWARRLQFKRIGVVAAAAIVLAVALNSNMYGIQFDNQQQALFNKGNLYLKSGEFRNAIDKYYASLDFPTHLSQVHLNLGIAFLKLGERDSAWNHFLIEDSLFDGSAEALNNLAYLYRQSGQYDLAATAAGAALEEKPYLPEARLNLWYALREAGRPDSAYHLIKTMTAGERLNQNEMFILAVSASDIREFVEADSLLQNLLAGMSETSLPSYSEASDPNPFGENLAPAIFESRVLYNLGVVNAGLGDIDKAIVFLRRAVDIDQNLLEGWINLGSAFFSKQSYTEALKAFETARTLSPTSEVVLFNLALAKTALGEYSQATLLAEECLRLYPDFVPVMQLLSTLDSLRK